LPTLVFFIKAYWLGSFICVQQMIRSAAGRDELRQKIAPTKVQSPVTSTKKPRGSIRSPLVFWSKHFTDLNLAESVALPGLAVGKRSDDGEWYRKPRFRVLSRALIVPRLTESCLSLRRDTSPVTSTTWK